MPTRRDIDDFMAQKRIAIVGVSRDPKQFANAVYKEFKQRGYSLYPVNPQAEQLEGDKCYPSVAKLPEQVDGAVLLVRPGVSLEVVKSCREAGIGHVWLGNGSVSPEAVAYCREQGISVVDGACPMMFLEPVGFLHACHRFVKQITGTLPK